MEGIRRRLHQDGRLRVSRKPYVCHACRHEMHSLCASDLDPKRVCTCDKMWHMQITITGTMQKFKGTEWIPAREGSE